MSTPVAQAHLHALRAAGVRAHPLAAAVGLGDGGGGLLLGEVGVLGALGAGDLLAGHRQLDLVHTEVDQLAHGLAHAFGAVGELGDRLDQRAAGDGDLGAVGQVAGAGEASGVDGVAARRRRGGPWPRRRPGTWCSRSRCRCGRTRGRTAGVPRRAWCPGRRGRRSCSRRSGCARRTARTSGCGRGPSITRAPSVWPGIDGADGGDAVVLDQDVARVGVGAGGVEDARRCGTGSCWSGRAWSGLPLREAKVA